MLFGPCKSWFKFLAFLLSKELFVADLWHNESAGFDEEYCFSF